MQAEAPQDIRVSVGIAAVERIAVMNGNHESQGVGVTACPLDDLFTPVHAIVAVNLPAQQHLLLRGVPQLVMCLRAFELEGRIEERPFVAVMPLQRAPRPIRQNIK
jgi:hypothetical protein